MRMTLMALAPIVAMLSPVYAPATAWALEHPMTKGEIQTASKAGAPMESLPWAILLIGAVGVASTARGRAKGSSRWCEWS